MYSNKKITNNIPIKKLIPFCDRENSTRKYSYTDGMNLNNEGRKSQIQSTGVPTSFQIEKLQKKLIETLETNYEINKKYGNILTNVNFESSTSSNSKSVLSPSEQKRSAAINLLRKRTVNIINTGDNNINSYRKGSVDESLLAHHNSISSVNSSNSSNSDKTTQRQQALSVLMRRVGNANVNNQNKISNNNGKRMKRKENVQLTAINTNFNKISNDNLQNPSLNNSFYNNRFDTVQSPNITIKNRDSMNSPYYNSLSNYDMINSPISEMPNMFKAPVDNIPNSSPPLNDVKGYDIDMNNSNNFSNILSPISPSTNFINNRKSINMGCVDGSHKIFENNRLIPNEPNMYDINNCPSSPVGNFSSGSFYTGGSNGRYPSSEELSQKIAENQLMIEYLSKLCMGSDINDNRDASVFASNMYNNNYNNNNNNNNNNSKFPPTSGFMNNDLNNFNDYTMQSSVFTSSSSPRSSPSQNFNEATSSFISCSGSQTYSNDFNKFMSSESPANTSNIINNLPSPYVNNNKIINSNIGMPSSPYLGNANVNIATYSSNINSTSTSGLTSPQFNATPSNSPYINMGMDKSQSFKRNSSYINLMGKGMPSPSPSFTNGNNSTNSRFNSSPGIYPVMTTMGMGMNELSPASFLNDSISFDLYQQQQQQQQQNKFNSKSIPSSPNVGYNEQNMVMDQRIFYDNKLNSMIPSHYNNNNSVQISQSMLPAYSSTTSVSCKQIPSQSIGAIGSLRHSVNKTMDKENPKKMNPLVSLASEKRKSSTLINSDSIEDSYSQLSLNDSLLSNDFSFTKNYSALLSGNSLLNNINTNTNNNDNDSIITNELSVMEPKPELSSSISDTSNQSFSSLSSKAVGSNLKNVATNQLQSNDNSNETTYKLFDRSVYSLPNQSELPALSSFESSLNAVMQNQSLGDSPIINSHEDKSFNSFNGIDIQMTSDAFSNHSNNKMFSLSIQHPVLS